MRISDWSSDVCSSDLSYRRHARHGDPRAVLLAALAALESDDIEAVDASPIIASDPLGPSRRRYANAVALVASKLSPPEMLGRLQEIEARSEEHTSELQSLMRRSYAVFCLNKKNSKANTTNH